MHILLKAKLKMSFNNNGWDKKPGQSCEICFQCAIVQISLMVLFQTMCSVFPQMIWSGNIL